MVNNDTILCLKVIKRYDCYLKYLNKEPDVNYCNLKHGKVINDFWGCMFGQQKAVADQCFMFKYRFNTVESNFQVNAQPIALYTEAYPKFGVKKTSYTCRAMIEQLQWLQFAGHDSKSSYEHLQVKKCFESYNIPTELFYCNMEVNAYYYYNPYKMLNVYV